MDFPSETGLRLIFLLTLGLCAIVLKFVLDSRRAGLAHIPGPFLARYPDAWRLCQAVKRSSKQEYTSARLMKAYRDVVRIGPTTVAVFDPAAIPTIYDTGVRLNKVWSITTFILALFHKILATNNVHSNPGRRLPCICSSRSDHKYTNDCRGRHARQIQETSGKCLFVIGIEILRAKCGPNH